MSRPEKCADVGRPFCKPARGLIAHPIRCQSLLTDITRRLDELAGTANKVIASFSTAGKMPPGFLPWFTATQKDPQNVRHWSCWALTPVYEMLKFAQDLKTCRKIAFARVRPYVNALGSPTSTSQPAHSSRQAPGITEIRCLVLVQGASLRAAAATTVFATQDRSSLGTLRWRLGGFSE